MSEALDDKPKCCAQIEPYFYFPGFSSESELEPCQFSGVRKFFEVDGKHYCCFHMPMEHKDGAPTDKEDPSWSGRTSFKQGIRGALLRGFGERETVTYEVADLRGVVFPYEFGLIEALEHPVGVNPKTGDGRAHFPFLRLEWACFYGSAEFERAFFSRGAFFTNVEFRGEANFSDSEFENWVSFVGARFMELADFSANEKTPPFPSIDFRWAQFERGARFTNRRFSEPVDFWGAVFHVAPDFHGAQLHQGCTIEKAEFLDVKSLHAPSAYRTLKLAMEEMRNWDGMAKFHALEERSLRHQPGTHWFVRFVSWSYDVASEYGQSLARPLVGVIGVFYFGFLLYCFVLGLAGIKGDASLLVEVLKFDTMQMVKPFDAIISGVGITGLGPWGRFFFGIVATLQTLATAGFVTLFILAVRRRFRMA
ncbi:MAG: pentapeptide repeat-containing protein [Rhodospirillales bacterium]|nr:pentapeptide repeat-containing protein [Rhodospirillales bacterium]